MSMIPRAIGLQGFGYGVQSIALQGFLTPADPPPGPTDSPPDHYADIAARIFNRHVDGPGNAIFMRIGQRRQKRR